MRAELPALRGQLQQLMLAHDAVFAGGVDPWADVPEEPDRHIDGGTDAVLAQGGQRSGKRRAHRIVERDRRVSRRRLSPSRQAREFGDRHEPETRAHEQLDLCAKA